MILANSLLSLLSPATPKGVKGDAPAADGGFSALFTALALPGADEAEAAAEPAETKLDPAALLALTLAATGKAAALPGKSGKILPLPLPTGNPVPAGDEEASDLALPEDQDAAVSAQAVVTQIVPGQPSVPVQPVANAPIAAADTNSGATAGAPLPIPAVPARALTVDHAAPLPASPTTQPAAQDSAPKVTLQVASQSITPPAKEAAAPPAAVAPQPLVAAVVSEQAPAEGRARPSARVQPASAHTAQPAPLMAAPILADAATPFPLMPVQAAAQAPATAGQDLAAIVDRLSAAREALAPASASLSIDHAEFGELSLRFDQKADGALTVQLAAATPEAHRAISAAVGAEGGHFLSAEGQPQPQAQPQQQQQSSSNATASPTAERDARNGQQPQRQDTTPRQQQAQRQPAATRNQAQGDGIFA